MGNIHEGCWDIFCLRKTCYHNRFLCSSPKKVSHLLSSFHIQNIKTLYDDNTSKSNMSLILKSIAQFGLFSRRHPMSYQKRSVPLLKRGIYRRHSTSSAEGSSPKSEIPPNGKMDVANEKKSSGITIQDGGVLLTIGLLLLDLKSSRDLSAKFDDVKKDHKTDIENAKKDAKRIEERQIVEGTRTDTLYNQLIAQTVDNQKQFSVMTEKLSKKWG